MASIVLVEMGEIRLSRSAEEQLQACGLGACVGLCLYEAAAQIAILVHVVLPTTLPPSPLASRQLPPPPPGKCADTAIAHALAEIVRQGGRAEQVQAALVGGAQIFTALGSDKASHSRLEIGTRNVVALQEGLIREGIALCAEDTGGHFGRTVTLDVGTGDVRVRPVGLGEYPLVTLGKRPTPTNAVREEVFAYGR